MKIETILWATVAAGSISQTFCNADTLLLQPLDGSAEKDCGKDVGIKEKVSLCGGLLQAFQGFASFPHFGQK